MKDPKTYIPITEKKDLIPILSEISIFGGLSEKQLHSVSKLLKKVYYYSGEYIFRQNTEPSYIYIIRIGEIKIIADIDDTPLEIIALGVGRCFGETSVIGISPHSANAIAVEDTELIVLSRESLLSIFDSDKNLFGLLILNIAREACRRLHKTDEILLHYVHNKN